jgi:hypothetical protein
MTDGVRVTGQSAVSGTEHMRRMREMSPVDRQN